MVYLLNIYKRGQDPQQKSENTTTGNFVSKIKNTTGQTDKKEENNEY